MRTISRPRSFRILILRKAMAMDLESIIANQGGKDKMPEGTCPGSGMVLSLSRESASTRAQTARPTARRSPCPSRWRILRPRRLRKISPTLTR